MKILLILMSILLYCGQSTLFAQKMSNTVPSKIGFHKAVYDEGGKLLPWTNWSHDLRLEMDWYLNCAVSENGYPVFIYTTFMDEDYKPNKNLTT